MEPGIFTQLKRFVEVSLSTADSSYITSASTENLEFVYPLHFSLPYFIEEPLNALNIWGVQASCVMKLPWQQPCSGTQCDEHFIFLMVFYMLQQSYTFCRCRFFWCKFNLIASIILHKVISYISFHFIKYWYQHWATHYRACHSNVASRRGSKEKFFDVETFKPGDFVHLLCIYPVHVRSVLWIYFYTIHSTHNIKILQHMVYFLVIGMLVSLIFYVNLQYASFTELCEHILL